MALGAAATWRRGGCAAGRAPQRFSAGATWKNSRAMLDLALFRDGGDAEAARVSQRRRGADAAAVDALIELDSRWRALQPVLNEQRTELARLRKAAAAARRGGGEGAPAEELALRAQGVQDIEAKSDELRSQVQTSLCAVGNLVHEWAPITPQAAAAAAAAIDGPLRAPAAGVPGDAGLRALIDSGWAERAAGRWRAIGPGILIEHALVSYALGHAVRAGYEPVAPPEIGAARELKLAKHVRARGGNPAAECSAAPTHDLLRARHACEWMQPNELPRRYVYVRRQAEGGGAAGGMAEVWIYEIWGDDGSVWPAFDEAVAMCADVHEGLGLSVRWPRQQPQPPPSSSAPSRTPPTGGVRRAPARWAILRRARSSSSTIVAATPLIGPAMASATSRPVLRSLASRRCTISRLGASASGSARSSSKGARSDTFTPSEGARPREPLSEPLAHAPCANGILPRHRRRCVVHVANTMLALAIQAQTNAAPAPDSADASVRRSTLGSIPAPLRTAMGLG